MKGIPYGKHHIGQEEIDAVVETLRSDFLTQGPKIEAFETEFANYIGSKYAVAVSNATAGLHVSALALNLQPGERVITTPITFAATANCVRFCNAEVWFADIDPETYLISYDKVKSLIESKPPGFFKGLILVDFAGLPVNLKEFRELAEDNDIWIIEDACHAPGGHFIDAMGDIQMCGNGKYADCSVFSFHPVKHIACGEGGMITTNSELLYNKLKLLRSHGILKQNLDPNLGGWYYEMRTLGFNYRLTDIQSAIGLIQLRKHSKNLEIRNTLAQNYADAFNRLNIRFQHVPKGCYHAYHLFIILTNRRKKLYDYLRENKIYAQIHYIPLHLQPYYKEHGFYGEPLENSEHYYNQCISLPLFPSLSSESQNFVIKKIEEFVLSK